MNTKADKEIGVILTGEEARLYRLFRRHFERLEPLLLDEEFLALQTGKIDINVHNGQIQTIHVYKQTYRRVSKAV